METRINSPWIKDNYRLFAWHQDRYGGYRFGDVHDQRYGVGAEWQANRKALSAILSQSTDGGQAGVRIDWSQWLNDHWQYQCNMTVRLIFHYKQLMLVRMDKLTVLL